MVERSDRDDIQVGEGKQEHCYDGDCRQRYKLGKPVASIGCDRANRGVWGYDVMGLHGNPWGAIGCLSAQIYSSGKMKQFRRFTTMNSRCILQSQKNETVIDFSLL